MNRKPGYGWVPDLPDHRDFYYNQVRAVPPSLPASVDLRSKCQPVENQGQLGSCKANALAGARKLSNSKTARHLPTSAGSSSITTNGQSAYD